jgi:hypothetical protein
VQYNGTTNNSGITVKKQVKLGKRRNNKGSGRKSVIIKKRQYNKF